MKIIPQKYRIKHKILEALWKMPKERFNSHDLYSLKELSNILSYEVPLIKKTVYELESSSEVLYKRNNNPDTIGLLEEGVNSYKSEKYLKEGWEKFKITFEFWVKNITILIGSFIAIYTFLQNVLSTKQNSEEIQKLKVEQQKLKCKVQFLQDSLMNLKVNQPYSSLKKKKT